MLLLIFQWHTRVSEEMFNVHKIAKKKTKNKIKKLKQCKIFEISLSESQVYKKWQILAIIREISDSNLETWR